MVCFQIIEILIWTSPIGLTNRWFYFTNVLCCPFQFNTSINETFMCVYPQVYSLLCVVGYIWQPLVKCPKVLNSSAADAFQNYFLLKGRIAIMHQSEGALIQHSAVFRFYQVKIQHILYMVKLSQSCVMQRRGPSKLWQSRSWAWFDHVIVIETHLHINVCTHHGVGSGHMYRITSRSGEALADGVKILEYSPVKWQYISHSNLQCKVWTRVNWWIVQLFSWTALSISPFKTLLLEIPKYIMKSPERFRESLLF